MTDIRGRLKRLFRGYSRKGAGNLSVQFPDHTIGAGSYGGLSVLEFGEGTHLKVGNYCSFAAGVQVMLGGGHRTDWVTTYPFSAIDSRFTRFTGHPVSKGDVVIGNDVWIGREAIIMSGISIGDGAVIAARSVVTKDVAPYEIVGGNPARPLRFRFSPEAISRLLNVRWWDWADQRIAAAMPHLLSDEIEKFLDLAERGEI